MAQIAFVQPGKPLRLLPLRKRIISIGSGPGCDICVSGLAELEANLVQSPAGWVLTPYSSKPLLDVAGKRIKKEFPLHPGVVIMGGDAVLLFTEDGLASAPAEAAVTVDPTRLVESLRNFTTALSGAFTLERLLELLLDGCIELCGADRGFLLLEEGDGYQVKVARNIERESIPAGAAALSDSIVHHVLTKGEPVLLDDALTDGRFNGARSIIDLQLMSVLAVPLIIQGEALGLIYLGNNRFRNRFDETRRDWAAVFAGQAALLLTNLLTMRQLTDALDEKRLGGMLGSCKGIADVFRRVEKVARVNVDVLVTGETGTGKELVAREIHERSERKGRFIALNCGAIPETLIESELFGHVKGSYTGAVKDRDGAFQSATDGTLFLDEVGELGLAMQVKLLRVIQEREVARVGSDTAEPINVRIVAATHRDLQADVAAGRFRDDLLYRLNVIPIEVPPLRTRGEDILLLARYFLNRYREELQSTAAGFSADGLRALREHAWPGNIRELENRIKRALVLTENLQLTPADLGLQEAGQPILTLQDAKEEFQTAYIDRILELNGGNRTKTAADLGVDPRTIYRHLARNRNITEEEMLREDGAADPS
jgi:transcriptional regulator with GAF, ATPase, and Fis domain